MKEQIIKSIESLSGEYSCYEIFSDWIKAAAISISNTTDIIHDSVWHKRENEFMEIVKKHGENKMKDFAKMTGMLVDILGSDMEDALGDIYMKIGLGSKQTGQFFTPFHLSELAAGLNLETAEKDKKIFLNEPSTGGGGMVIAAAKKIEKEGINYQENLIVTARDLDWKGVYMSYVQFSLLGIQAAVIQGDSLTDKKTDKSCMYFTPAYKLRRYL